MCCVLGYYYTAAIERPGQVEVVYLDSMIKAFEKALNHIFLNILMSFGISGSDRNFATGPFK